MSPSNTAGRACARACALALVLSAGFSAAQAQHDRGRDGLRDGPRDALRHGGSHGHPGQWHDRGHGSNRHYPQPGWAVQRAPAHARSVFWGGINYRYLDSVWYAPGPRGFVVVRPPLGLVFRERPAFATLVGVGALAYWYANGVYYRELRSGGGYEVVAPPAEEPPAAAAQPVKTFVYPRLNQSAELQASDEYECHQWAVRQSSFDPTAAATGQKASPDTVQRDNYQRATGACLDGRGYTVR